jgi:hypothetical protein
MLNQVKNAKVSDFMHAIIQINKNFGPVNPSLKWFQQIRIILNKTGSGKNSESNNVLP